MRDIKYIEDNLNNEMKYLEKVDTLSLGSLLKGIYYRDKDVKGCVGDGLFEIKFDCHDTGVSTNSYIIKPDGTRYQIASRTYWYDEWRYGFNKKWYESGAWDTRYNEFVDSLRNRLKELVSNKIDTLNEELSSAKELLSREKSDVEAMFL